LTTTRQRSLLTALRAVENVCSARPRPLTINADASDHEEADIRPVARSQPLVPQPIPSRDGGQIIIVF
jgi:hypothetical protein